MSRCEMCTQHNSCREDQQCDFVVLEPAVPAMSSNGVHTRVWLLRAMALERDCCEARVGIFGCGWAFASFSMRF